MTDAGPDARRETRLSTDEVALVLRRAAEIEAGDDGDGGDAESYDLAAVEAAAGEVGLAPEAVRRAVAELRLGALTPDAPAGATRRRPRARPPGDTVSEQRAVPQSPEVALGIIERLAHQQLFEVRRRDAGRTTYRPRQDMVATLRRRLDFGGRLRFAGVTELTASATPVEEGALVRLDATPATTRTAVVAGSAAAGTGVALVGGLGGALLAEPGLVIAALPAGAAVGTGALRARTRRWERHRRDIADALTVLLDRI